MTDLLGGLKEANLGGDQTTSYRSKSKLGGRSGNSVSGSIGSGLSNVTIGIIVAGIVVAYIGVNGGFKFGSKKKKTRYPINKKGK
jgi:hypothetical protein